MTEIRERARLLRKNLTDAERLLWQKLRYWQVDGLKFRRQLPIGPYIVDFVCLEKRLIIEVDGGQHAEAVNHDEVRDAWLSEQGFIVTRFWNNEVLKNIEGVMSVVVDKLHSAPYLVPSPQGGRRNTKARKHRQQREWLSRNRSQRR